MDGSDQGLVPRTSWEKVILRICVDLMYQIERQAIWLWHIYSGDGFLRYILDKLGSLILNQGHLYYRTHSGFLVCFEKLLQIYKKKQFKMV